jgi:hypothetical protein
MRISLGLCESFCVIIHTSFFREILLRYSRRRSASLILSTGVSSRMIESARAFSACNVLNDVEMSGKKKSSY